MLTELHYIWEMFAVYGHEFYDVGGCFRTTGFIQACERPPVVSDNKGTLGVYNVEY